MPQVFYTLARFFFLIFAITWVSTALGQDIRINEFQALNSSSLSDSFGEFSDWIEIYNYGAEDVNLSGFILTDNQSDLEKWEFPDQTLKADSFLVVFASGKDLSEPNQELHTNFKLSGSGEYLALLAADGNIIDEFYPAFPTQENDLSWGYLDGGYLTFSNPTPGKANESEDGMTLPKPVFNKERGYYEDPFEVEITSPVEGSEIYYTTNGNTPSKNSGTLYTEPVLIEKNELLRAVCTKESFENSPITTTTYLFLNNVLAQPNDPPGYPSEWGPYFEISGNGIADYEMDTEIINDQSYQPLLEEALLDLPAMSIVTDIGNLFSNVRDPETGGVYIYTGPPEFNEQRGVGDEWERPVSVEYFNHDGSDGFQIDCGLRIHGGHSRRVEKTPKHSFRLAFRSKYGASKLNYPIFGEDATSSFNTLILRAGFGNSFTHHSSNERNRTQYIRDLWGKDTQLDMGHLSGKGNFVHLFLNGLYWGIYNPTERIDNSFAETYLGGNKEEYDIIKDYGYIVDGDDQAWNDMMTQVNSGLLGGVEGYQKIQGNNPDGTPNPNYQPYVDVINLIDYMIINFYGANWDWDHHNWAALRNRVEPGKGFQFFSWDAEHIIEGISANVLREDNENCPSRIFQQMRLNKDFVNLFADRIQFHFFNGGALTESANIKRWMNRADQIDTAIIAESARWGDYRRDVHPWRESGPFDVYTQATWLAEQDYIINDYFPRRKDVFLSQLKSEGLFPLVDAPDFFIDGTAANLVNVKKGDLVEIEAETGTIYFTMDGSDPREDSGAGDSISSTAIQYSTKIQIVKSTYIKARVLANDEWSALSEFVFADTADFSNLKITEIHYQPLEENELESGLFEFVELKNTGDTPLDLSGLAFKSGIKYKFEEGTILGPGKFTVIASSPTNFVKRYPVNPIGKYEGRLSNGGEKIALLNEYQDTVISVRYDDELPWPIAADGEGFSLVPTEINPEGNQKDGSAWRASLEIHGSPGKDDVIVTAIPDMDKFSENAVLYQNFPNPANDQTTINFEIKKSGIVSLQLFDHLGKKVIDIKNGQYSKGIHSIGFDTRGLSQGLYYYKASFNGKNFGVKKMLIVK